MTLEITNEPWKLKKVALPQHTDHGGVMWHGAYLAWLEESRVCALSSIGLPYKDLIDKGIEMPVVDLKIKYRKPIEVGDEILLESHCLQRRGVRWPWYSRFLQEEGDVYAEAFVDLVLVRLTSGKRMLVRNPPEDLQHALTKLQSGPLQSS